MGPEKERFSTCATTLGGIDADSEMIPAKCSALELVGCCVFVARDFGLDLFLEFDIFPNRCDCVI